jgi:putative Mg2+ transporter-C (MgtC) family protein
LLRPLVNAINRAPIDQGATEAIYEVHVTTATDHLDEVREFLRDELEAASYPPQDIDVIEREQGDTELVAILLGSTADPRELDAIVSRLERRPHVDNASWNLRTTD